MIKSRQTLNDASFAVYAGTAMSCADQGYRFALLLTLDEASAIDLLRDAYEKMKDVLDKIETREDALLFVTKFIFEDASASKMAGNGRDFGLPQLDKLSVRLRAAIGAIDMLGLTMVDAMEALNCDETDLVKSLAEARQQMMS